MDKNLKNPKDDDRYKIIENELKKKGREEDKENIINLMNVPKDIQKICKNKLGKNTKIAIIGAGVSGLIAAFELKKIGCDITVYEASKRVGGKVYTYYFDRIQNHYGDFGEIGIPITHNLVWHYINLFNLKTEVFLNENNSLYLRDTFSFNRSKEIENNIYEKFDLKDKDKNRIKSNYYLQVKNKYLKKLNVEERKELLEIKEDYSENIKNIDNMTYRDMLKKEKFSEEAINLISYINGDREYLDFSLIELLNKEYTLDYLLNYKIKGGMIKLPLALYESILNNESKVYKNIDKDNLGIVKVNFGCVVNNIKDIEYENKIELEYKNLENNNTIQEKFDYVICTVPLPSIKRISFTPNLSKEKLIAIDDIEFQNSQKLYFYVKEKFWQDKGKRTFIGNTITDLPICSMNYLLENFDVFMDGKNNINIKINNNINKNGILLASYSSGYRSRVFSNMDYEIKLNDTMNYIEKIHNLEKGYLNKILIDYKALNWNDVQYIWGFETIFKKNEKVLYSYALSKEEMKKKLYFAGEHTSSKHGSIQGDIQSTLFIVNKIAEEINNRF